MDHSVLREDMVDGLEHSLDQFDEAVDLAMRNVPRHEFVTDSPYQNKPTAHRKTNTTILAPTTVARLLTALAAEPEDDVLIVGAGVGYTAAVLAEIVGDAHVHAVDITRSLVYEARTNLQRAGYDAVLVDCRDGADGLPEYAPYDRILVEASAVRPPRRLRSQLAADGRLVMPKGTTDQTLVAIEGGEVVETFGPLQFKPLLVDGEQTGGVVRNRTKREDPEYEGRGWHAGSGWEQEWIDWGGHN
ncbi:protein-L-isoaspartate O-methyltransferase [Haloferax larsenii]|uniref:protein-L-isoaspartate(D-aspartate) O-methyltransferase n=1 Tax=Haloferax larsenii TaxID=302484 RepID=A0ABY5RGY4_HALLR|nr:protein-L-isoaspartate O-methyltransferase [Haloferax larsenii]ELZ75195.1 protein-L-isoaspartate(D-aspartate) O-methyltransferase [Haloferax larsenii JCM 13917]UVE51606.1 protein-L-isoaspartate O-methyltransferase [Haloferax larsenii]